MAKKKPIISPLGQWAYPGEVTIIPSSKITMKGVNYPVLGIDDLGNSQMMMPDQDYTFPGNYVTEIPQMGKGGLSQWFDEKWVDVKTGKTCGRSGKDKDGRPYPACRPSRRVNETTPKTTSEMSSAEKTRFKREKTSGKRIDYNHKRRELGGENWLDQYQVGGPETSTEQNPERMQGVDIKRKRKNVSDSPKYQYDNKGNLLYTPELNIYPYLSDNSSKDSFWVNPKIPIQNLNPTVEELRTVAAPYYPIDNKLVSDPKLTFKYSEAKPSNYQESLEQEYVLPEVVGKSFGNLPLVKDDGYSPNRRWITSLRNGDKLPTGYRYHSGLNIYGPGKYAYVLKTDPNNLVNYPTKNKIENDLSLNDKELYDYLAKNNYSPDTVDGLTRELPDQIWNRAEQMRVEMRNNPEIMSWANLHNVDLGYKERYEDSEDNDDFAPKIPESIYASRLAKSGLPTNRPDYDYGDYETYIAQDPSKFNLVDYFPVAPFLKDARNNEETNDQALKKKMAKRMGIDPSAFDNGEYLIHYNKSPITEYTPGKKYGGWLDEFQTGGIRRPIYTSNPRDPRIGRYTDSLNLYNKHTLAAYDLLKRDRKTLYKITNRPYSDVEYAPYHISRGSSGVRNSFFNFSGVSLPNNINRRIKPIGYQEVSRNQDESMYFPVYKKPVQPYIYKKPVIPKPVIPKPVAPLPVIPPPVASVPVVEPPVKKISYSKPVIQQFNYMSNENKAKALQKYGSVSDIPFQGVDINQLKNGGWLEEYQRGGWAGWTPNVGKPYMRTSPAGNAGYSDNTRVVNQNTNVSAANRKAAEAAEYAKRVGSVSQGQTKSAYEKARDASSLVAQAQQRKGSADPLDYVLDAVNPAFLPFAGIDLVGNTAMGVNNLAKGNFSEAAGNAIDAGFNALDVIPAAAELRGPLRSMIRSRGVRPDFTPNVSNQLAPPPSEIIVDATTGQFNSYFNQDMERPYFDEWVRMMNNNASELDVSNLFANPAESIDLRKLKKIAKNRSGLTKEEILKNASPKNKKALTKMSESEFEQTVLKPTGDIVPYEPAINLGLGFDTNTKNLTLSNTIPMGMDEYTNVFNSKLDRLNEIISRNNKSGLDYSVKGLSPSGALTFNTPAQIEKLPPNTKLLNELRNRVLIDSEGNMSPIAQEYLDRWAIAGNRNIQQGESTWMLDINPGQWRGEVEDIANAEYFKAIPGLNMRNTTASVFSDALPRRGTRTYNSINEYLKELGLGRVKSGFNSQSQSSSGLWEDAIKKGKAFGYFNNPETVYGSMRTVSPLVAGAAAASQLPEQKNGGWLNNYQEGGENLPELNSKIDIANFYKNPLSEKYGIYQDPTDKAYKYYLKSGDETTILQSGPDLSNINSRRLVEINSQKGSLSNAQLINIKNVSPVILPEQKQRILRDKVYYDQEDLMEQAMSESPIPSVKTPSYSEILESDPEFKRVMTEKPKPVAPIKPKPVAANTPLVPIGNAPRAIVKPAVRKVVAKNNIVNLADLTITSADKAYLNKVEEYCPGGNCLETTRNAYDMLPGRIQGIPTSSDIWSNDLKIHSKKGTPTPNDIKQYPYFAGDSGSGTVDSWDIHGVIVANGGKNLFNINNPTPIDYKQIPVGAVIGWGPANKKDSSYSGRSKGYNKQFGMQPSHHSTMVTGYSETGEPIVYDGYLKKYMTLTEAKTNIGSSLSYELENISAPKSILNNTQDNLKSQGILLNYIPPTNVNPNKILAAANQPWAQIPEGSAKRAPRFNKQMMTEFNSALMNNKGELMRNLNISSEKYDELAKVALAISAQESEGGGALGVIDGSTIGMTQLNPDNIFKDDKLKKAASKPYILNDGSNNILKPKLIKTPSGSAVATMIYLSKLDKDSERYYNEGKVPKDRSFTKNSNIIKDALRSNTSKYNADGFFVEEANKRIDLSPFEGGILSSPDPVAAQKLLNKTAGVADKYKVSVKNGSLVVTMKTKGNADLSVAERIGYAWQSPNTLKSGDAQGDSVYTRRIKNYYDLLNNTTPTYRKEGGQTGWLNKYK